MFYEKNLWSLVYLSPFFPLKRNYILLPVGLIQNVGPTEKKKDFQIWKVPFSICKYSKKNTEYF